jgi:UV DNA damage endonuclease
MSLGYCCLIWGIYHTNYQTLKLASVTKDKLNEIIAYNLDSLENAIDFNIANRVKFFRLSSDIIPFASSPVNQLNWLKDYKDKLEKIGLKIKQSKMRVSFHPGQYSVLNSPDEKVVNNTILDLEYHAAFLKALGLDYSHKMVLHIGGVYGDKDQAINRFAKNFKLLSDEAKNRLIIENDDKSYHTEDALRLASLIKVPVVYDNFHNSILTSDPSISDREWIIRCSKTWLKKDGKLKIHYSTQQPNAIKGTHSYGVTIEEFEPFYNSIKDLDIDIMLEVKDKNISVLKLINIFEQGSDKNLIRNDFNRFKYWLMAIDEKLTAKLEKMFDSKDFNGVVFYKIIEKLINNTPNKEGIINVCRYMLKNDFKDIQKDDLDGLNSALDKASKSSLSLSSLKANFYKIGVKYQLSLIINSYFFND